MNILVDSCSYNCQNVGDLAMLTVAVARLRELWPSATIRVITNAPQIVTRHCGPIEPVPVEGRRQFLSEHLLGRADRWIPGSAWRRLEESLRFSSPGLFNASAGLKHGLKQKMRGGSPGGTHVPSDVQRFLDAIQTSDLLVVNGAGILTDAFRDHVLGIFATIELAVRRGIPVALFGQGIGPLDDPELRRRAAEVLPRAAQIAVRESHASVKLLASLGVDPSRIKVTGDDAIELALPRGNTDARQLPNAIGVNVRVAAYAAVSASTLADIKDVLVAAAASHGARLVGVPIAHHGGGMDLDTLRELDLDLPSRDYGAAALDTPRAVIDRIGECRLVVTGSYHGAVFALAQGIPVVALAKSPYYVAKMSGVADQFRVGCEVVRFDAVDPVAALRAAIDRAWDSAETVRRPLIEAAEDQVRRSRAAYLNLQHIVAPLSITTVA
jgi:polysaccharide pyruvyl transferase WcaK-like protein